MKELQEIQINIIPFLAEAFSTNEIIYKDIDKLYNTDKLKFISLAKEDEFYNHHMAMEGDIEQEYYFKKSLGIILAAQEDDYVDNELIQLCKKGWKYCITHINNAKVLKLEVLLERLIKKKTSINNISDDELNSNMVIAIFIGTRLEREFDYNDKIYNEMIRWFIDRMEHYKNHNRINIDSIPKKTLKQLRDFELKIKNQTKISNLPSSFRLDIDQYQGLVVDKKSINKTDKFLNAFEYIFDYENISLITIVGKDFLKSKHIQELIYAYTCLFEDDEEIDFEELIKFLYPAIQIRYLCREYKKSKKYFFENFDEGLYNDLKLLESENKDIKKSNLLIQDENESLKLRIDELERENKKLKGEINEINSCKNEVIALREFIFNLDNEVDKEEDKNINDSLSEYKGVIVGGSYSWQNKLKSILSKWTYIPIESINFDENIVKNNDYVFLNITVMSHAMYYKIMSIANSCNTKIYLINTTNIDLTLSELWKKINN